MGADLNLNLEPWSLNPKCHCRAHHLRLRGTASSDAQATAAPPWGRLSPVTETLYRTLALAAIHLNR
jgi:hypothetical protein